jgi:RNA polymerase sigma-70 factor (ECF subfamily)
MGFPPTDEELVAAVQAGDSSAFDELVLRWERKIRGAVYRVVGSEEEARDVTQEAFLKAYRGLPGFKSEARFSSWLYQIALNLSRDRLRRRKLRDHASLDAMEEDGVASPALVSRAPDAHAQFERGDLSRRVAAAVAALPDDQREVIVLKEYQDLTFVEIAEVLDLPVSTVKTRLYRGLTLLRARLEQQGVASYARAGVALL